jgi:hypothetical protein
MCASQHPCEHHLHRASRAQREDPISGASRMCDEDHTKGASQLPCEDQSNCARHEYRVNHKCGASHPYSEHHHQRASQDPREHPTPDATFFDQQIGPTMTATVEIHREIRAPRQPNGWQLCFQDCTWHHDDRGPEHGYRSIWRDPFDHLQPARGQARIPELATMMWFLAEAARLGWFVDGLTGPRKYPEAEPEATPQAKAA